LWFARGVRQDGAVEAFVNGLERLEVGQAFGLVGEGQRSFDLGLHGPERALIVGPRGPNLAVAKLFPGRNFHDELTVQRVRSQERVGDVPRCDRLGFGLIEFLLEKQDPSEHQM